MAWETRNGTGRYYTRSRREGGRVIREYIGTGQLADLAADLDRLDRDEREAHRRAAHEVRRTLAAQDAPTSTLHRDVEALARGALLAAGFHRHRGQWRRRRG